MMLKPGCRAGSSISPSPASGPEFIQRKSLAIFMRLTASVLSWPESSTAASWRAQTLEKVIAGANGRPVFSAQHRGDACREFRMGVDAGADGRAALGELVETREGRLDAGHAVPDLLRPAAELLAQA